MSPEQRDKLMDRLEQVRERLISIEIDIKTHAWWYLDTDHLDDVPGQSDFDDDQRAVRLGRDAEGRPVKASSNAAVDLMD